MKVLLINPYQPGEWAPPPVGYLQGALKHYGVNVIARDLHNAMTDQDHYDIVGVSFHSFSMKYAKQIRNKFKGWLICGGHHVTALPDQLLSIGYDQVVLGEGENAIIDIVRGNKSKVIKDIEGRYFPNINDIPFPDYSGLEHPDPRIPIISSRGCPFSCSFCDAPFFWERKYKIRSADNVLSEIEKRKSEGWTKWSFHDDNFLVNKTRLAEICKGLDGKNTWDCQCRAESLTEDVCKLIYNAGCRLVHLGIESFSQGSLDRCGKKTTVDKMIKGIENAYNAGITTMGFFIVGLPGDTIKDIEITYNYRKQSKLSKFGSNILWILPGTEIYRKAKEQGFDDKVYLESGAPFYTYEQSLQTLQTWKKLI